jgi:WD40 repeat protein
VGAAPIRHGDKDLTALGFSSDGKQLITCGQEPADGLVVAAWRVLDGARLGSAKGHCDPILTASRDGRFIYGLRGIDVRPRRLATSDWQIAAWDVGSFKLVVPTAAVTENGFCEIMVSTWSDGGSSEWRKELPARLKAEERRGEEWVSTEPGTCRMALSADGRRAAASDARGAVWVIDLVGQRIDLLVAPNLDVSRKQRIEGHWCHDLALSPDGRHLADRGRRFSKPEWVDQRGRPLDTETKDSLVLWDVEARKALHSDPGRRSPAPIVFSNGGKLLAQVEKGYVVLWDVERWIPRTLDLGGLDEPLGGVRFAFAPDDRLAAVGLAGGEVQFFDIASGRRCGAAP